MTAVFCNYVLMVNYFTFNTFEFKSFTTTYVLARELRADPLNYRHCQAIRCWRFKFNNPYANYIINIQKKTKSLTKWQKCQQSFTGILTAWSSRQIIRYFSRKLAIFHGFFFVSFWLVRFRQKNWNLMFCLHQKWCKSLTNVYCGF